MRSAAEPVTTAFGRGAELLDQVDYRLARTPEEKEEIYRLRYRAYVREGAMPRSAIKDGRVIDRVVWATYRTEIARRDAAVDAALAATAATAMERT